MPRKPEVGVEDFGKTIGEIKDLAGRSRIEVEEWVKEHPLESAAFLLMAGLVFGLLWGTSMSRRG